MLRRSLRLAGVALAIFALAACTVSIGPAPLPDISGELTAQTSLPPSAQLTGLLGGGEVRYYRVNVPDPKGLLLVEAEGDSLRVSLRTSSNIQLGVSTSPRYFAYQTSQLALASDGAAVGPSSILPGVSCLGPCVAERTAADSYLMRVQNTSGSSRSFALFAYTLDARDTFEPNGSRASAEVLPSTGNYQGAIEWLGDEDWFVYTGPNNASLYLVFTPFDDDLGLELEFMDCDSCQVLDGSPDAYIEGLINGDVLRVRSAAGRAGPASSSGYDIEIRIGLP